MYGPFPHKMWHTTRTDTMRGTYWHVAAHGFGGWRSRLLSHKLYFRKQNQLICFPQSHHFLPTLCTRCGRLLLHLITLNHTYTHTHTHTLLWTRDQPDAEPSACKHTTLARDRHPCRRRDSNPQFQHASGRRPTP